MTREKAEKLITDKGYDVFNLEYDDGDSDGRFRTEFQGSYIRFIVLTENKIEILKEAE
jgi:hypothetical protein